MRRWQIRHNAELLVVMILVGGGFLCMALWMKLRLNPSSTPSVRIETSNPDRQQKTAAAVLVPSAPVNPSRACAEAMRPATGKSANASIRHSASDDIRLLAGLDLAIPVSGTDKASLYDSFSDGRGERKHEAIDIHAARGTPVIAVGDGCVVKLFRSVPGGITLYQFDPEGNFAYYYAHLDRYADGVKEGTELKRGDVLGYVGTTGNAPPNAPHLHFGIFRLGSDKRWWAGTAVNPYKVFTHP